MASAFQLTGIAFVTGVALANILVLAGLACIAVAIFGWASQTIAASGGFRAISGLTGTLLLFYVYGSYTPSVQRQPSEHSPAQTASAQSSLTTTAQTAPQQAQQTTPQSPEQSVPPSSTEGVFSGKWKNADPKAASVLFLKVEEQDGAVSVRAWGMCLPQQANRGLAGDPAPQYCDWGTGHGTVRDGSANVTWQDGPVLRRMKLVPAAGSLRVMLDSTYRDRRPPQHSEAHFARGL